MNDTHESIRKLINQKFADLTGEQRLVMGAGMHTAAREMAIASFPKGISKKEIRRLLFHRFYENDYDKQTFARILSQLLTNRG